MEYARDFNSIKLFLSECDNIIINSNNHNFKILFANVKNLIKNGHFDTKKIFQSLLSDIYKLKKRVPSEHIDYSYAGKTTFSCDQHGNTVKSKTGPIKFVKYVEINVEERVKLEKLKDLLYQMKKQLEQKSFLNNKSEIQKKVKNNNPYQDIIQDIVKNFRKIVKTDPQKEKDVQDYLEAFLDVKEYCFLREKETTGHKIKSLIPDFTLQELNIALEVKFVDKPEKIKSIIDEMRADISGYSKIWKSIIFLVYDIGGNIRHVDNYVEDLNQDGDITVRCIIIKH